MIAAAGCRLHAGAQVVASPVARLQSADSTLGALPIERRVPVDGHVRRDESEWKLRSGLVY
jgi:hypothetical protein